MFIFVRVSVIANRFFKESIMNIAGFPLQGFGQMGHITGNTDPGNFDIGNPANPMNLANFAGLASQATQPGGLPNAAFDLFDNFDVGQFGNAAVDFVQSLVEGHDPLASGAQLVDNAGLLPDNFSAQDVLRGGSSLVYDGNIGSLSSLASGL